MHDWNDPIKTVCVNHSWFEGNLMWLSCYVPQKEKKRPENNH